MTTFYGNLAKEFQVDPYTGNQLLQDELSRIANFVVVSGFGLGKIMTSSPKEPESTVDRVVMIKSLMGDGNETEARFYSSWCLFVHL
ncbi:MAG: hypothetical protein OEM01_14035 [Desulfobulbaceae bacterium]|nr:hypothetical protein [Desulfobulbaceae bacterium]